jgi:pimeloyl-ACP methyl ester carboxylesterase
MRPIGGAPISKRLGPAILLALLASPSGTLADAVSVGVYRHPQQLIGIGNRHLNLYCVGQGKPTVLLDAGLGGTMASWRAVQLQIGTITKACSYDRAGYGYSDAAPGASDINAAVQDVHQLIVAAHLGSPVVYVGHSLAGVYGIALNNHYPQDVAGEVLVDPSVADQLQRLSAGSPERLKKMIAGTQKALATMRSCLALAEKGELAHLAPKMAQDCVDVSDVKDPAVRKIMATLEASPKFFRTEISEWSNFFLAPGQAESKDQQEMGQPASFGNKPLIVLTRSNIFQDEVQHQAWVAGHEQLAALSKKGSNLVVTNSGHDIQLDQPAALISAVHTIVADVRGTK